MFEELLSDRLLAVFVIGAPGADEHHGALRTETAKMTLLLNPAQGRLRHRISQSDRFQIHSVKKRAPLRGALSVLPLYGCFTLNAQWKSNFDANRQGDFPDDAELVSN
ncbi:MAG TPA: hypothetical protein VFA68_07405 [Terriglobales bacterium]|nr:hypothetical protein [Terriglobales bacterium]